MQGQPDATLVDLFRGTSDAMIAVDSRSHVVGWNPAAEALFGLPRNKVLGKSCADVLRWRDRHGNAVCGTRCAVRSQALGNQPGMTQEVLGSGKSGRAIWVSVSSLVLPGEHHQTCRIVHLAREVTFTPLQEAAVRFVHEDQGRRLLLRGLTPREHDVLDLMTDGLTSADIARRLSISPITVQNHIAHILAKLKVHSRLEAVSAVLRAH